MEGVDQARSEDEGIAESEALHALAVAGQRGEQDIGGRVVGWQVVVGDVVATEERRRSRAGRASFSSGGFRYRLERGQKSIKGVNGPP